MTVRDRRDVFWELEQISVNKLGLRCVTERRNTPILLPTLLSPGASPVPVLQRSRVIDVVGSVVGEVSSEVDSWDHIHFFLINLFYLVKIEPDY